MPRIEDPAAADLMNETRSPLVWHEQTIIHCHGHSVPTVPIEVQLATMLFRQQKARIAATIAAIEADSSSVALLERAIADRESPGSPIDIPVEVRQLLTRR